MRTVFGLDTLSAPANGTAVTVGTFDGVHVGHRALIARTVSEARRRGWDAVAITWDRHPNVTLRPERVPPLLTTLERKIELLEQTGLDGLVILAFDEELSQWPPERFVNDVLVKGLGTRAVFVGEAWRFGHKAMGDFDLLTELGQRLGFEAHAVALSEVVGEVVSSSRVRAIVEAGDMELAATLLGRPFDIEGPVVRGDDRGASLGFPTANVVVEASLVRPPRGVYAGRARVGEAWHMAAINFGVNPTFGGDPATVAPRVEAYLLDFEGDLYGQMLRIEFHKRLRDERKFASVEELVEQITRDVEVTRSLGRNSR